MTNKNKKSKHVKTQGARNTNSIQTQARLDPGHNPSEVPMSTKSGNGTGVNRRPRERVGRGSPRSPSVHPYSGISIFPMTLKICQALSSWPQPHPNQSTKADGNRFSLPLLSPHLLRLLALFFPSTFFSVISSRLGTVESHSEAGGQKRWGGDGMKTREELS